MSFTICVEIPALNRLCDLLETSNPTDERKSLSRQVLDALEPKLQEALRKNFAALNAGVPGLDPEPQAAPAAQIAPEPQPQPVAAAQEPPRQEPAPAQKPVQAAQEASEKVDPKPQPVATPEASKASPVTMDAVQRAAADLRDQGKLKAVTDMFPEFEIRKLSDLAGEKLQAFAERLRKLGAKL